MSDFTILTVCTGNICRSPLAEQLLRAGLAAYSAVTVESSGTQAMVGSRMDARAAAYSQQYTADQPQHSTSDNNTSTSDNNTSTSDKNNNTTSNDPAVHIARQVTADQVRSAGLVLALSREHRKQIVELLPRASRYTFTLRELARLLDGVTSDDLDAAAQLPADDLAGRFAAVVQVAAENRGGVKRPEYPDDDDVIDPYGQSDEVYAESVQQLVPAVRTVLSVLQRAAAATAA